MLNFAKYVYYVLCELDRTSDPWLPRDLMQLEATLIHPYFNMNWIFFVCAIKS